MSVCHVAHLALNDENLDMKKLLNLLDNCRKNIPQLVELQFGKNNPQMYSGKTEKSGGSNYALFSRHLTPEAIRVYQDHPDHVALANYLISMSTREPYVIDFANLSKL